MTNSLKLFSKDVMDLIESGKSKVFHSKDDSGFVLLFNSNTYKYDKNGNCIGETQEEVCLDRFNQIYTRLARGKYE